MFPSTGEKGRDWRLMSHTCQRVERRPRKCSGDISEMKIGTTADRIPIPAPPMTRPMSRTAITGDRACSTHAKSVSTAESLQVHMIIHHY